MVANCLSTKTQKKRGCYDKDQQQLARDLSVCVCVDQKGISDDDERRKKREEDRQIDRESARARACDGKSRASDEREQ